MGATIVLNKDPPISLLAGIYRGDTFLECWLHLLVITLTPCVPLGQHEEQRLMPHPLQQAVNEKYTRYVIIHVLTGSKRFAVSTEKVSHKPPPEVTSSSL